VKANLLNMFSNNKKYWDTITLGELCLEPFTNGITLTQKSLGYGAKLVNVVDLYKNHTIDVSKLGRADASEKQLKQSQLKKGDIIFVRSSVKREGAAMCAYFPGDSEPVVFGCFNIRFRPNPKLVDSKFITLFLRSPEGRKRLLNYCTTATITNINQEGLGLVNVPLPPLAEQKRIAAILEKCDRLRRTRRYTLQLSDTFLQSVFLEMFGKEASKEFPLVTVESLVKTGKNTIRTGPFGSQLLHSEFSEYGDIIVLGIDNVVQNRFTWENPRYITFKKYDDLKRYTVSPGDILITIMGSCGRCAIVPDNFPTAINTKHLCCITLEQKKCLPTYLQACFLKHPLILKQLGVSERGAVMPGLNMNIIKDLVLPLPPLPLQEKFAQIVQKYERLRTQQRESDRQAEHLFQTLLHRAFRGELTPQDLEDEPASLLSEQKSINDDK
jgi:type I restriction enzyme S subunit